MNPDSDERCSQYSYLVLRYLFFFFRYTIYEIRDTRYEFSISHDNNYAIAEAIAIGREE